MIRNGSPGREQRASADRVKRRARCGGFRCEVGPSFVAAAVAAGALSVLPTVLPLAICIIAGAAAAGGMLWGYGTVHRQPSARACGAAALLGAMLAATGGLRLGMEEGSAYLGLAGRGPMTLHGTVIDDSRPLAGGGTAFSIQVSSVSRRGGALRATANQRMELFLRDAESLQRGEMLSVALEAPPETWRGRLVGRPMHVERHGFRSPFWKIRASLRERVVAALARAGPAAGLATAVLIGDRRYLDPSVVARFRRAGASHLLALSGLHVGIVYGCVLVLMRCMPRRAGPVAAAAVAAAYALIATGGPALARAAMMASVGSLLAVSDRERRPVPIIALAALMLLAIEPAAAAQLSFQLSFLALLGVLAGARVAARLPPGLSRWIGGAVLCSVGAQAATAPLVLTTFGALYPGSVLLAPLLMPAVTVFLVAALGMAVAGQLAVSFPSGAAGALLNLAFIILDTGVSLSAAIPGISV